MIIEFLQRNRLKYKTVAETREIDEYFMRFVQKWYYYCAFTSHGDGKNLITKYIALIILRYPFNLSYRRAENYTTVFSM